VIVYNDNMIKNSNWFDIDKQGLAQILARKGKEFAVFELIQNAWDEPGVTEVETTISPDTAGYGTIRVRDNAPEGFKNLTHAYTLFASSTKKANPEQRGRFNLGEKLVLALSREAHVATTTGTISFNVKGRTHSKTKKTIAGSEVQFTIKMSREEMERTAKACTRLIPPPNILTTINGCPIEAPARIAQFDASLITEVSNPDGELVKATRKTSVDVYAADDSHAAAIYEMGIPVCEIEGKYSFNVGQKVPLTMDREAVLPQFAKQLAVAALNALKDLLDAEDANTGWATIAVASPDAEPAALQAYMTRRFGDKRVAYDPSDPEANNRAVAEGYVVVHGAQLSGATWANVKAAGVIQPAGQVTPSAKPYSENGEPLKFIDPDASMQEVALYAKQVALHTLQGKAITVAFASETTWPYAATYGPSGSLTFNVGRLGRAWFNLHTNLERIDDLLIHEFGHQYAANHLSEDYHKALTGIGSRLAQALRNGLIK
jgi:hypothetical protein